MLCLECLWRSHSWLFIFLVFIISCFLCCGIRPLCLVLFLQKFKKLNLRHRLSRIRIISARRKFGGALRNDAIFMNEILINLKATYKKKCDWALKMWDVCVLILELLYALYLFPCFNSLIANGTGLCQSFLIPSCKGCVLHYWMQNVLLLL